MNRYQWKYIVTGPKLVLATLTVVIAMVLGGGNAFAGVGAEVNEAASLRLTSTGVIRSSLKGFVRLQLQVSELNGTSLRARAQVESDGLIEHRLYGMWLSSPEGNALLIDTARADEECEVDPDTGKETGCERVLDLRGFLTQAPFNVTTLEGWTINIREQVIGTEATVTGWGAGQAPKSTGCAAGLDPVPSSQFTNSQAIKPDNSGKPNHEEITGIFAEHLTLTFFPDNDTSVN